MMRTNGNEIAADFITSLDWATLPESVRERALISILDGLGAVLAGTLAPISRIAGGYAAESWRGDAATIFQHDPGRGIFCLRAGAAGAAFANACSGNALDIDDDAIFTRGHPGAQLVPTVLAVGEKVNASGRELLEALVVGYEIAIRAGHCWHDYHSDYQADGSWGSMACAAAAARLLKLDRAGVQHALGIAEYHAPNAPMMRDIANPAMVKHAIGWGAMTGVTAAELAACGYTGIPSLLGMDEYYDWVNDLGTTWWSAMDVGYKGWTSCAWGHPACIAAQRLVEANAIPVAQIAAIRVDTFAEAVALYPGYPTTTEEAQFSLAWPLACLLIDGEIGPNQILEHRFTDPLVRSLVDKIAIVLDPEMDAHYKAAQEEDLCMPSRVEITTSDGRRFDSGLVERGPEYWGSVDLEQKFVWLVGHVLAPAQIEGLIRALRRFDELATVGELVSCL